LIRLTPFNDIFDHQVPPLTLYTPMYPKSRKHTEPNQSRGRRLDLAKPLNENPSAAEYHLKRFLD